MLDPTNYINPSAYGQFSDLEAAFWDFGIQGQNDNLLTSDGMKNFHAWMQQLASTSYQNWYNSAPQQMKRAMEAGINPYLAAQGIAGSSGSNSVAPAPAQTQSKLPEFLGAAGSALSSLGSGFSSAVGGIATALKLRHEIDNIDADTASIFSNMGFSKLQAKAMSIRLKYMDEKEQIGVWQALADFDKTKAEYSNLLASHNNILAQYDEIIARKDLIIKEQGEVEARAILDKALADKAAEEANWNKLQNEFFENHGYRVGDPLFEGLRDQMVSNGTFDMETFGDTISGYQGKVQYAIASSQFKADEETAYGRAHNAGMGSYDSDPYQQQYRQLYDEVDNLSNQENEVTNLLSALNSAHKDGKITDDEFKEQQSKLLKIQRQIRRSSDELNKHIAKMNYSVGHASQLQQVKSDLLKIGVAVGLYNVGKQTPAPIKGFSR